MPNHIINDVNITGRDLHLFAEKYISAFDEGDFFNKVIPMPRELRIVSGGVSRESLPDVCEDPQEEADHGYLFEFGDPKSKSHWDIWSSCQKSNITLYGVRDWYDWSCRHWGTKWDAYDQYFTVSPELINLTFSTAWSHCFPIIKALSTEFPTLNFDVAYCDEGIPENSGLYEMHLEAGIDESDNHPNVLSDDGAFHSEILSRTYGEDWWEPDSDGEDEEGGGGVQEEVDENVDDDVYMEIPSDKDLELFLVGYGGDV